MTYEEAIKRIEYLKNKAEISLNNIDTACEWLKQDVSGTITAFSMAIEALEKQLPKMPIKSDREIRYCDLWKCPSCGFEWSSRVVDFCYKCGQRLDWEEIE